MRFTFMPPTHVARMRRAAAHRSEVNGSQDDEDREGQHASRWGGFAERVLNLEVHGQGAEHEHAEEERRGQDQEAIPDAGDKRERYAHLEDTNNDEHPCWQSVRSELLSHVGGICTSVFSASVGAQQPDVQQAERGEDLEGDHESCHPGSCRGSGE